MEKLMKDVIAPLLATIFVVILIWTVFVAIPKPTPFNLDEVKANASTTFKQAGYGIIGYEGYQWGSWHFGSYGGAAVWYSLRRNGKDNGIIYTGYIKRWGDEYHIYNIRAIDAIKP